MTMDLYPVDHESLERSIKKATEMKTELYDRQWKAMAERIDPHWRKPGSERLAFYEFMGEFLEAWFQELEAMSHNARQEVAKMRRDYERLRKERDEKPRSNRNGAY